MFILSIGMATSLISLCFSIIGIRSRSQLLLEENFFYCSGQMKFASEARPSQYIGPFGNIEPTCMPLSGHLNRSMNEGSRAMTMFFLKIYTVTLTLAYHNYWSNPDIRCTHLILIIYR